MSYFKLTRVSGNVKSGESRRFIFPFVEGIGKDNVKVVKAGCVPCTTTKVFSTHVEANYQADTLGRSETSKGFSKVVSVEFKDGTVERLFFEGLITR